MKSRELRKETERNEKGGVSMREGNIEWDSIKGTGSRIRGFRTENN